MVYWYIAWSERIHNLIILKGSSIYMYLGMKFLYVTELCLKREVLLCERIVLEKGSCYAKELCFGREVLYVPELCLEMDIPYVTELCLRRNVLHVTEVYFER